MMYVGRRSVATSSTVLLALICGFFAFAGAGFADAPAQKEWTFLIYLNGNNSLDSFGTDNLKQMETVGSTDKINIVVQWASESAGNTKRMLIQKSTDPSNVTSPVVQLMPQVDMGDYNQMVEFAKWGIANYPAKHYFYDVWDHGNGWHKMITRDLSYDEVSGNHVTTAQFGIALSQIAQLIGGKIDLVGTDACLMAMAEVTSEIADSVSVFAGSEEVEPGPGWPYDTVLTRWNAITTEASATDVGKILAQEYVKSYNGSQEVTFSVMDLSQQANLESAIAGLATELKGLPASQQTSAKTALDGSLHFELQDYTDLGDIVTHLQSGRTVSSTTLSAVQTAMASYIVDSEKTQQYAAATGLSIWWPTDASNYSQYSATYGQLKFQKTGWNDALAVYFKN